ncbi:MAG TPA: MBG domain-containing protein [Acidobacteriaceae bacterium]|jgi:sugar lactone lactonase YvrE
MKRTFLSRFLVVLAALFACSSVYAQLTRQTTVSTLAGTDTAGYAASQDGASAAAAQLNSPHGVVMDVYGNLYIADTGNNRVRRIDGKTGVITTIAGNGTAGYRAADENTAAINGELNAPQDLALDELGNLYIADTGNHRVRKLVLSTGLMATFAGTGNTTYNQQELGLPTNMNLNAPTGIAVDAVGNLYIADAGLNRLFFCAIAGFLNGVQQGKIATVGGNGTAAYTTTAGEEGVSGTVAHLSAPGSVGVDRAGAVYIADNGNKRIRKLDTSLKMTTVAGNGSDYTAGSEGLVATATGIGAATAVRTDIAKNIYIGLAGSNRILKISIADGKVATFAGTGSAGFADKTVPLSAGFSAPAGLALNGAGTLFIADAGNNRVRALPVATGNLLFATTAVGGSDTSRALTLSASSALTLTSITMLTPSGATAEFALGTPSGCSLGDSLTVGATCTFPVTFTPARPGRRMVAVEVVTSLGTQHFGLSGMGSGPVTLFSPGTTSAFAGTTVGSYTASEDNGPATAAHFLTLDKLAVDGADSVYISDQRGSRIRKITNGIVSTVAGNGLQAYVPADEGAAAISVGLASPYGVVVDAAGNVFIADTANGRIRRVDAVTKKITTVAGNGNIAAPAEGVLATATGAGVTYPLSVDQQGNLYFGDSSNRTYRIDAGTGIVNAVVATNANGAGALNCSACKGQPVIDDNGVLYLAGVGLFRANLATGAWTNLTPSPNTLVNGTNSVAFGPSGDIEIAANNVGLVQYTIATNTYATAATYDVTPSTGFVLDSAGNAFFPSTASPYKLVKANSQTVKLTYNSTVQGATSTDSPKSIALFNAGSVPMTFSMPTSGTNPSLSSDFQFASTGNTCPQLSTASAAATLAVGGNCVYKINFSPLVSGTISGQMSVTDNQYGASSPVTQVMSLNGTATPGVVATSIVLSGLANTTAGTAQTVTVKAYDASSNVAATYRGTVTFSSTDTASGVLPAAYTFTAADNGVHSFTVTLKTADDRQTVFVTDGSLSTSVAVKVSAAAAVSFAPTLGTPQSAFINTQFSARLVGKVVDAYGNGVPGITVTFSVPASGASATLSTTFPLTTDSLGEAGLVVTANGTAGSYDVTATAAGLATPATFALTNKPVAVSLALTPSDTTLAYGNDVRITANISPATVNNLPPSGMVTFYEGATVLGTGVLNSSKADFLVIAPTVGQHTYSASYVGDSNYSAIPATAGPVVTVTKGISQLVTPFTQTVVRPGTVSMALGNGNLKYLQPSGVVAYTLNAACGSTPQTGSLTINSNGVATLTVPVDCPAGQYDLTLSYAGDSNYLAASTVHVALTVVAQAATITITNLDQVYDGTPKPVTVTTNPANLAVNVIYGGSSSGAPTLAGLYSVLVTIADPNYTGSQSAALLIRRGPVGIVWPDINSIVYGTPLSTVQLNATTSVQGTFSYSPVAGTILTPGTYTLNVTFTPNDSPTTPTTATQRLVVTKAGLTVHANDAGRLYNAPDPAFSATVTGAVNGDTFTTGGTTTATLTSPIGQYPIAPTVTGANLAYYVVTAVNGTLTITGAPATITLSNLNQIYDGSAKPVTVTTAPAGLAYSVTYNGSSTAPTQTGSYPVVATITDPNYTGTANGVLIITAGSADVTWPTPAAITYGVPLSGAQLNASSTTQGSFVYSPATGAILQPGTQTLTVVFTPTNTSFAPVTKTVSLVVNKATLTITAANAARHFGEANPALSSTLVGAVNGDTFSATAATTATAASPVGAYVITPVLSGPNLGAYTVTSVNGTLTVTSALSTVQLTSTPSTAYVGDTVTFTAVVSGAAGTPTGTVEFFNGSASLGVKTLSAGRATYATSSLAAGTYTLSAVYSGDPYFAAATSANLLQTISPSDYSIAVNPTVLTIKRGETGRATFTLTPLGSFQGTINFACSSVPTNATCDFSPSSVTLNGVPATTVLTIATTAQHASLEPGNSLPWQKPGSGVVAAGLLGVFLLGRRNIRNIRKLRRLPTLMVLLLLAGMLGAMTGCAAVSGTTTTPVGSYSLSVGAGVSGGAGHSVNLTVNIVD